MNEVRARSHAGPYLCPHAGPRDGAYINSAFRTHTTDRIVHIGIGASKPRTAGHAHPEGHMITHVPGTVKGPRWQAQALESALPGAVTAQIASQARPTGRASAVYQRSVPSSAPTSSVRSCR